MALDEEIPDRCLICYSNSRPGSQSAYLESSMTGCSMISKQLHVVFILRNVLEVPKEILQTYLLSRGSPETWVWVCENCSRLIVKAKHVYNDWLEASKRFKSVKEKIVGKIRTSVAKEGIQGLQGSSREKLDQKLLITNESRNFVNIREYGHFTDPFVDGDYRACQRLKKGVSNTSFAMDTIVKVEQEEFVEPGYFNEDGDGLEAEEESHVDGGEDNIMSVDDEYSEEDVYVDKSDHRHSHSKGVYRANIGSYIKLCKHCHLRFPAKHFEAHVKLHHSTNAVGNYSSTSRRKFNSEQPCSICPATKRRIMGKTSETLNGHMEMHKTSGLHCFICLMVFRQSNDLNRHMWTSHPETRNKRPAAASSKPKKKRKGLVTKLGNVKCPKCTRYFPPELLNGHLMLHERSPHHCSTCGNVFRTASALKDHLKYHITIVDSPLSSLIQTAVFPKNDMDDQPNRSKSTRDFKKAKLDGDLIGENSTEKEADLKTAKEDTDRTPEMNECSRGEKEVSNSSKPAIKRGPYERLPKVQCPWCSSFSCRKTRREKLCEHLLSCDANKTTGKNELMCCPFCKDYSFFSLEVSNFVEHAFCCRGELPDGADIPVTSRIFQCNMCPTTKYMSLGEFMEHSLYHRRRPYKCKKCPKRFDLTASLQGHWIKHHRNDLKSVQPLHRFTTDTSLPQFYWWCPVCSEKFTDNDSRDIHMVEVHKKELEKTFSCKHCSKSFWCPDELSLHEGTTHTALINFHTCDVCQQQFHKKVLLRGHRIRKHRLDMYICEVCGNGFTTKLTLSKHVQLHDDVRKFPCDQCDASFVAGEYLKQHKYRVHVSLDVRVNPLVCHYCKKVFNCKAYLSKHIACVHEKKYPHICHICGNGYSALSHLTRHLALKHGIGDRKKYEKRCPIEGCNRNFWDPAKLKAHVAMHRKEPQFECNVCKKGFYDKWYLRRHELIHKNAETKPYKCHICNKRFPVRNYLYIHMKSHRNK